jgi:hypothetical protein
MSGEDQQKLKEYIRDLGYRFSVFILYDKNGVVFVEWNGRRWNNRGLQP